MVKNEKKKFRYSHWALHAVKIRNMNDNDAKQEAKKFIARKVNFFRRLKNGTLSFRNIPKTKFIPRSYRSKKINDNITLVYGRLKPQFATMSGALRGATQTSFDPDPLGPSLASSRPGATALRGDGIIEDVGKFFSPREDYNNISRETLNKYGMLVIKKMVLYRTPIQSMINTALNIITLGKWNQSREKYHFDKLFHLALVCTLSNGKNIIIEKNAVVNISDYYETKPDTEIYDNIIMNKEIKPKIMLDETLANIGAEKFFIYDPVKANCQVFLRDVLSSQGLYNESIDAWLFQDLSEMMAEQPGWTYPISKLGTRVSAVFNKLFGYGRPEGTTKDDSYKKYVEAINKYKEHNCPSLRNKSKKELEEIANRLGINPFTSKSYDMPAFSKSKLSQKEKEAIQQKINKLKIKEDKLKQELLNESNNLIQSKGIDKEQALYNLTKINDNMNEYTKKINKLSQQIGIVPEAINQNVEKVDNKPKVNLLKDTKKLLKKIKKSQIPNMKIEKKKSEEITKKLDEFEQFIKKKKVQKNK